MDGLPHLRKLLRTHPFGGYFDRFEDGIASG